jgi:hypothetical protein
VRGFGLTLGVLWLAAVVGCAPGQGGWDPDALGAYRHDVDAHPGQRLIDVLPHLQPDRDGGALFLCRWSTVAPIPVSLPLDASAKERRLLRSALAAWAESGLGVRFIESPRAARLEIRFADIERDGWAPSGAGDTIADCAISADFYAAPQPDRVAADMSFASIYLKRMELDSLGRARPLSDEELMGTMLHELGHALGFAGHAAQGDSIMGPAPERARRHGRAVLAGKRFRDPTLAALYALPSGIVVGRIALAEDQRRVGTRLANMAAEAGWRGPWSRVGDDSARLLWREGDGIAAALDLAQWPARLRAGQAGAFEPNRRARSMLRAVAAEGPR